MKSLAILLFVAICFVQGVAQKADSLPGISYRNAVSFNIAGTTPFIGITYERLLSQRFNVEVGIGAVSAGTGIKYFPWPITDNKMVFHMAMGTNFFKTPLDDFGEGEVSSTTFMVVGLTYIGMGRFNFSLDVGLGYNYDFTYDESSTPPYGSLKIGYRF